MYFAWDEAKRNSNLEKHGFDFSSIVQILAGKHYFYRSNYEYEARFIVIGFYENVEVATIFTNQDDTFRVISMRRARDNERKALHALTSE